MPLVFVGQSFFWVVHLFRVDGDASDEVSVSLYWSWHVLGSWSKDGFLRVVGSKDNRELGVVNPPLFPVYLWLVCRKPWIPQYGFVFSEMGQEESEFYGFSSRLDL